MAVAIIYLSTLALLVLLTIRVHKLPLLNLENNFNGGKKEETASHPLLLLADRRLLEFVTSK